jgi:hypothetical protein
MTVSFMPNSRFCPQNQEVHAADRVVGKEFLNDELLVRIHSIIDIVRHNFGRPTLHHVSLNSFVQVALQVGADLSVPRPSEKGTA